MVLFKPFSEEYSSGTCYCKYWSICEAAWLSILLILFLLAFSRERCCLDTDNPWQQVVCAFGNMSICQYLMVCTLNFCGRRRSDNMTSQKELVVVSVIGADEQSLTHLTNPESAMISCVQQHQEFVMKPVLPAVSLLHLHVFQIIEVVYNFNEFYNGL